MIYGAVIRRTIRLAVLLLACVAPALRAQEGLRGSREKMLRQNAVAQASDFPFLETPADVEQYAELGVLVPVEPDGDLQLGRVSFAVTRPEVRTFVERLAPRYHAACREPLVVTSLTRPVSEQPENASELSVHPAGMAVDLRRSSRRSCRRWIERTLLSMQDEGVLAVTKESRPAHYHVAVFPQKYTAFVERLGGELAQAANEPERAVRAETPHRVRHIAVAERASRRPTYRVQRGDTLGRIAEEHGVSLTRLKRMNGLRSSRIAPGQVLRIPLS